MKQRCLAIGLDRKHELGCLSSLYNLSSVHAVAMAGHDNDAARTSEEPADKAPQLADALARLMSDDDSQLEVQAANSHAVLALPTAQATTVAHTLHNASSSSGPSMTEVLAVLAQQAQQTHLLLNALQEQRSRSPQQATTCPGYTRGTTKRSTSRWRVQRRTYHRLILRKTRCRL